MAASWPSAKKTFTQIVNGVAKLVGLFWNTSYDEIEAMQTFLGAPGAAQTHLADLLSVLKDSYTGGRCYKKDADEIYVGPFAGIIANAAGTVKKLRVSTSVTTLAAANLDTGAFAAATYYYIYATADAVATTPTFVISASASAPTGYTHYRKIGWFYNETINILDITGGKVSTFIGGDNNEQQVYHQRQDQVTCTVAIPANNSSRTSADGTEVLTNSIIPSSNSNILKIEVAVNAGSASGGNACIILLDGSTVLATSRSVYFAGGGSTAPGTLIYFMTSPGTSPKTFSVRMGNVATNDMILNYGVAAAYDNGKLISSLTITEKKA